MAKGKKRGCGAVAGAKPKPPKRTKNHRTARDPFEASRDDDVQYEVETILHKVCLRRAPALPLTIVVCRGSSYAIRLQSQNWSLRLKKGGAYFFVCGPI